MLNTDRKIGQKVQGTHAATGETFAVTVLDIFLDDYGKPVVRLGWDDPQWLFHFARDNWKGRPEGVEPHPAKLITKSAG